MKAKLFVCAVSACLLGACATSRAPGGALIGAASGAVAGAGVGFLISDEDLLGSSASPETGDTSLPRGGTLAASLAIGTVVGAVVGAMVGHQQESPYPEQQPDEGEGAETGEEVSSLPPRAF